MELPFFSWIDSLPAPLQPPLMAAVKGVVTAALNAKVDFDVELIWQDKVRMGVGGDGKGMGRGWGGMGVAARGTAAA
jgi:hypothetical protein